MPGVVSATEEKDKFVVNAAIPIGGLTAGDYVVRAIIGLENQPAGRVFRAFRKVGLIRSVASSDRRIDAERSHRHGGL
jgi:hypothetical protein